MGICVRFIKSDFGLHESSGPGLDLSFTVYIEFKKAPCHVIRDLFMVVF